MKKGKLIFALVGIALCCAACGKLGPSQEYQQKSLELVNQKINATKEQVNTLAEQAKSEAVKQYEQLKYDTKEQMKDSVNKKIDSLFE